jgi:hypothetical protein
MFERLPGLLMDTDDDYASWLPEKEQSPFSYTNGDVDEDIIFSEFICKDAWDP